MSIFAKFNDQIDKDQLAKDIEAAAENRGNDGEVPEGTYEVEVEKIECKETSKGAPMLSIWFNILSGEYEGYKLFFNQVLQVGTKNLGWQMKKACEFVESLGTDIELEDNTDLVAFEEWTDEVFEEIQSVGSEYDLKYWKDKKGYSNYNIEEVYVG